MKGKIILLSLLSSVVGTSLLLTANYNKDMNSTSASSKTNIIIDDNFNSKDNAGKLDSDTWSDFSNGGMSQSTEGKSYLTNTRDGCENVAFSTKNKISNINYFQYDFKWDKASNRWFAPVFMNRNINGKANWTSDYAYAGLTINSYTDSKNFGGTLSNSFTFKDILGANAIESWLTCRITVTSSTTAKVNYAIQGNEFDPNNERTLTYDKLSTDLRDSYVGIVAAHDEGTINFDNFIVNYGSNEQISEDFSNFDVDNPNDFTFFKDSEDTVITSFISDTSDMTFNNAKANSFILSKTQVTADDSLIDDVEILNLSFNVKFLPTSGDETIAIYLGIKKNMTGLKENSIMYEIKKNSGVLRQFVENKQITNDSENTNVFKNVNTSGSTINIKLYKNGAINVYENNALVKNNEGNNINFTKVTNYEGFIAISCETDINSTVSFDNVKAINTSYFVPVTKSVTHNFSNNFFGNKGSEDFFLRDGDGGGNLTVTDGKLYFDCGTDGTFFGSNYQYDDFILDFKLCSILTDDTTTAGHKNATVLEKWIGLDLSRETKELGAYGNYATILTTITPNPTYGDVSNPGIFSQPNSKFVKDDMRITNHKSIPNSLFTAIQYKNAMEEGSVKDSDAICFRFVSSNGNLKLYLKKASEVNFTLYYEIDGLELNGYFALCCTGYTFMKIDDFSMTNTSGTYVCADNEVPETIIDTKTETIYDHNNVDVNLNEEILLNTHTNTLALVFIITTSVLALAVVALFILVLRKKKYEKKNI